MSSITSMLQVLDEVPNVPFFTNKVLRTVRDMAKSVGLSGNGVQIWSDSLGLYITLKRGKPTQRIFLCSHLDHPGFVFDSNGIATSLGSVGGLGNRGVSSFTKIAPMDLYTSSGKYLDTASVTIREGQLALETKVSANTVGMWHLENTSFTGQSLTMRSADNHVATAMLLQAASDIWQHKESVDLVLVFTTVEEVFQMSMTGMCLRENAGKPIREDSVFIMVEAMEMKPSQGGNPSYDHGPLIKVNDAEVGYGCGSKQHGNVAEMLLLNAAARGQYQHTYSGGYTDATALSLLTRCPNIATLAIPCQHKHNVTSQGVVTPEQVKLHDVLLGIEILKSAVYLEEWETVGLLSPNLRSKASGEKKRERVNKYRQNRVRLAWNFYHPVTPIQWVGLAANRVF